MTDIQFTEGDAKLLPLVAPLWKKLTRHHAGISVFFSGQFRSMQWPERRADLLEKSRTGKLHIALADTPKGACVGYCVGAINPKGHAEIESLFVEEKFRKQRIGSTLVRMVIDWFEAKRVKSMMVNVAVGNENAFKFYEQWGFYPRVTALVRKNKKKKIATETLRTQRRK
ncbi:MAG TPA: GNAT family N-acetyltransferase [Chitinivibrionales bacterium]|nr:GNAT family N-acetyltransferase [Chitinivibrionales bacterium]